MCDQTEVIYKEGDIVWVKLGSYFWPGEVQDVDKLDEEILVSFKKKPIAAVKFFDEDKYEYVKNLNQICFYNCRKKHEYIKKGLDMYRRQKEGSYMDKFPDDVRKAELRTNGNPNILADPQFQPQEKPNYHALFGSDKKGKQVSPKQVSLASTNGRKSQSTTPVRNPPRLITITHPRFIKGETEHKIHIRQQPSSSESRKSPASTSGTAAYKCQLCDFTSNRLNVIVLHNKFHSANAQTSNDSGKGKGSTSKNKSPVARVRSGTGSTETKAKSKPKSPSKESETPSKNLTASTPQAVSPPKVKRKAVDESTDDTEEIGDTVEVGGTKHTQPESPEKKRPKVTSPETPEKKKSSAVSAESPEKKTPKTPEKPQVTSKSPVLGKRKGSRGDDKATKKIKSDEEIREKLLADWEDEDAEQEEKEMERLKQQLKAEASTVSDASDSLNTTTKSDDNKTVSCFDFDDSKDAILDNELEERAKKFVENRKVPKVADDKVDKRINKLELESPATLVESSSHLEIETDSAAGTEDFNKAINTLLAETEVPKLPEIPVASSETCKSSNILPDVVLDSNLATNNESNTEVVEAEPTADFQGGDHDYSAKQKDEAMSENPPIAEDDILDINSMPVVMADAVITDEPSTSQVPVVSIQMPKIDLIPNPNSANTHTIVMNDGRLAMSPSVQSVVKAARGSNIDRSKTAVKTVVSVSQVSGGTTKATNRLVSNISKGQSAEKLTPARGARLLQQGIASGKYVIVQPTGTVQPRATPKCNMTQQIANIKPAAGTSQQQMAIQSPASGKLVIITKPQSGGQQQVLTALTPAQQKALVAGGKLPSPQRLLTSTGQLLTPVNPRNVMAKGTKLTQVTGQQIRTLTTGKQTLGPKLQMQSLQTKIILPAMETVKVPQTQPQSVVRMVTTGKTQSNTILIQATQGSSMLSSIVSRVSASTSQLPTKPTVQPKQQRPRLLTSTTMLQQAAGKPATVVPSSPKVQQTRQAFQPRMLLQKSRPALLANSKNDASTPSQGTQVSQAQVPKQRPTKSGVQAVHKVINTKQSSVGIKPNLQTIQQPLQKTVVLSSHSLSSSKSMESVPPLAPMQLAMSSSNETISLSQAPGMPLPSFQANISEHVTTSANALGDNAAPTYMLLTIDEAGNLQPYTSQSLISYDANDQAGQTIYIDGLESSGELDNIILTIGNSSSLNLDMGQTNTMTNVSSIYNTRAPSSSQDILAAALANTDVFQSEVPLQDTLTSVVSSNRSSVMTPCVVESSVMLTSPPSSLLLPSLNRAADVSETSLTLNQPIMTPLEVPSSVVPTRAPAPISFPIDLPLTATQTLTVPMTSYTVVSANTPSTESLFQPSMPLLSEELSDGRTTTSDVSHSHSRTPYDASQEQSELGSYTTTLQIVQDDNLCETKLMYQPQLATQVSQDHEQGTEQSESFTVTSLSEEPHCPTSAVLSARPLVVTETALSEEVSSGISKISNSFTHVPKPLDIPMAEHKKSVSLPSSVLPTDVTNSSQSLLPKEVGSELQDPESCSSRLSEFLQPQSNSDTSEHSTETASRLDPSTGLMVTDTSFNMETSVEVNEGRTSTQECPPAMLSDQTQIEMRSATDDVGAAPQSMPSLSEEDNPAGVEQRLSENESLKNSKTDSQCGMDSSTNGIKFDESGR